MEYNEADRLAHGIFIGLLTTIGLLTLFFWKVEDFSSDDPRHNLQKQLENISNPTH